MSEHLLRVGEDPAVVAGEKGVKRVIFFQNC